MSDEPLDVEAALSHLRSHWFPKCPACGAAVDDPEAYEDNCDESLLVPIRAAAEAFRAASDAAKDDPDV